MAFCPTAPDPSAIVTQTLISPPSGNSQAGAWITIGEDEDHKGDYSAAGTGTRNFGKGVIRLTGIPAGTTITEAWLIFNTYVSNNQPVNVAVTMKNGNGPATPVNGILYGICNSTCWYNPPAITEPTTYLRNRIYAANVTSIVTGNGNYTVDGLPVDLAMPIGTDGARIPGCTCSQGAVLFVAWNWNDFEGELTQAQQKTAAPRGINVYLGAVLLSNNPGLWGGARSYNLPFQPVKSTVDDQFFKGNSNITAAAGDAKTTILADTLAINQVRFVPPNKAWTKNAGNLLSVKKLSVAQLYDGVNSAYATTPSLNCIDWFLFIVSGDKTQPKAQMEIVNCAATALEGSATLNPCQEVGGQVQPSDPVIWVDSNFVRDSQSEKNGHCRAVKYTGGTDPPKSNAPGMFPNAPFYIGVDKEIMKVIGKCGDNNPFSPAPIDPDGKQYPDPPIWKVLRGQNGTPALTHEPGACVYLLAPPKFISDMASGLAAKGMPQQRPSPGRPLGRMRK